MPKSVGISRRQFLTYAAVGSAVGCLDLFGGPLLRLASAQPQDAEMVYPMASNLDCGGKCFVKAHVRDGVVTRISTRTAAECNPDMPVMKCCVRGRSYRKLLYHPDRLKYPLKRTGPRGSGSFTRISWDEAIATIATRMQSITEKYGPASRYFAFGDGNSGGALRYNELGPRFFNVTGGFHSRYYSISTGNLTTATPYTYGVATSGSTLDTLEYAKLIVLWGHNPVETQMGHLNYYLKRAKEHGCKIIVVDPRYSDSAISYGDQWIPLLPGTDNALLDAMAYVIVTENLHDQAFLDRCCLGFDEEHMPEGVPVSEAYLPYLLGKTDGIKKTPEWAEKICKVNARVIRQFAIEYARTKPAALYSGWGVGRQAAGERIGRGTAALCCLTGNVGKLGGWAGGLGGIAGNMGVGGIPTLENPVKVSTNVNQWLDLLEDPQKVTPQLGLKGVEKVTTPIKMILSCAGNYLLGSNTDINRARKLLEDEKRVEFIVSSDIFMTPSCQWSDLVLPSTTFFESWNLSRTFYSGSYTILTREIVKPLYEAKTPYTWMLAVCEKLGVGDAFSEGRTEKEWVMHILDEARKKDPTVPSWEGMLKQGIHYFPSKTLRVAFQKECQDPTAHPFKTPSGKIELCSKRLYDMHNPEIPATAHYVPAWEGSEDKDQLAKYPLQLITWKDRTKVNSVFDNHPWLCMTSPTLMWIHPDTAAKYKIADGDRVRVYNDRGALLITAHLTERIIPNVLGIPNGVWYNPDSKGTDQNGAVNVLTTSKPTALGHGNAHQSILVALAHA
ncbi:MAG: molybdopterin-dependent oxidoreductase [Desulfovibrio sp.]|nr:molybdopterin-dependent oxidoreductase [Desulfovibrio sp.]